jgi:putative membrane protein
MTVTRITSIVALSAAAVFAACAKRDKSATTSDSAAGAMAVDSSAMAPALTDANIVAILDEANAADSAAGKIAAAKGTSADVKAFGKMMVSDHHALRAAGQDLAKKLSITPMAPAGDNSTAEADAYIKTLNDTPKGPAFDKLYIDHEVTAHEQVLQTAQQALKATQNADLKALIEQATPVVQKHLDRAKAIQAKLSTTA